MTDTGLAGSRDGKGRVIHRGPRGGLYVMNGGVRRRVAAKRRHAANLPPELWALIAAKGNNNMIKTLRATTTQARRGADEYHARHKAARAAAVSKAYTASVRTTVYPLVRALIGLAPRKPSHGRIITLNDTLTMHADIMMGKYKMIVIKKNNEMYVYWNNNPPRLTPIVYGKDLIAYTKKGKTRFAHSIQPEKIARLVAEGHQGAINLQRVFAPVRGKATVRRLVKAAFTQVAL